MALKTDYQNFVPPEGGRRYQITQEPDGTSKITDVTQYEQEGDTFGAEDMNATNTAVNGAYALGTPWQSTDAEALSSLTTPGQYTGTFSDTPVSDDSSMVDYVVVEQLTDGTVPTIQQTVYGLGSARYVRTGQLISSLWVWSTWSAFPTKAAIAANFYSLTADAENLPSSTSISTVTTPGIYTGSGNAGGPEGGQFLLIVETHGTYARQTIDYSGEQYVRWGMADGSYWLSWEKLTNDGARYVADAGTNSGWDYRRWSDGKVEFWSSAYITGGAAQIEHDMAYPFTLTGAPIVWTQGVDNCWDLARPIYVEPSVNKNIKIYLYPRSTDSRTYRVNVYAVGNMA